MFITAVCVLFLISTREFLIASFCSAATGQEESMDAGAGETRLSLRVTELQRKNMK